MGPVQDIIDSECMIVSTMYGLVAELNPTNHSVSFFCHAQDVGFFCHSHKQDVGFGQKLIVRPVSLQLLAKCTDCSTKK